jgi:hypothetical protein
MQEFAGSSGKNQRVGQQMTAEEFALRHPKPWHYEMHKMTFTLKAANGSIVGQLVLANFHVGIPQVEWNRHVAAALKTADIPVKHSQS